MRIRRCSAWATAIAALTLIAASQALAAGTVNVTINGVGTVRGSVMASGAELNCARDGAGSYSGTCSVFVANERICEGDIPPGARPTIPPCFMIPRQLDLYAADSGAYGFTHWSDGRCTGTGRGCTITMPVAGSNVYAVTTNSRRQRAAERRADRPGRRLRARRGDRRGRRERQLRRLARRALARRGDPERHRCPVRRDLRLRPAA